ncbi:hypothetical protein PFISCL1PPCAC_913, partial [Pristionchus fissidentatus]
DASDIDRSAAAYRIHRYGAVRVPSLYRPALGISSMHARQLNWIRYSTPSPPAHRRTIDVPGYGSASSVYSKSSARARNALPDADKNHGLASRADHPQRRAHSDHQQKDRLGDYPGRKTRVRSAEANELRVRSFVPLWSGMRSERQRSRLLLQGGGCGDALPQAAAATCCSGRTDPIVSAVPCPQRTMPGQRDHVQVV